MRERILAVMEKNSRIDIKDLAILLGESEVAVANEIAQMEKEHIICVTSNRNAGAGVVAHACNPSILGG